ncbi:TPA: fimbrial protein [Klebsiella oxytoca]
MMTGIKRFRATGVAAAVVLGSLMMAGKVEAVECVVGTGAQENGAYALDQSVLPVNMTFPFSITRMSGSAEPVGSTLYSGNIIAALYSSIKCNGRISGNGHTVRINYENVPLGIWAGDIGQYSGKIYNTGVDGVGFIVKPLGSGSTVTYEDTAAPVQGLFNWNSTTMTGIHGSILPQMAYALIKTGPISYGTIDGALLPSIVVNLAVEDLDVVLYRINFSGSITINKPTCRSTEANKLIQLGSWHKPDFANVGDASDWVDSSLIMICDDAFWGGSGGSNSLQLQNEDSFNIIRTTFTTASTENIWAVRLTSSTGLIDATQGIIALDTSNGDNATGVGIQISSSADAAGVVDLTTGWGGTIALGSSTFRIPIFARYIRTGDITPGSANGKVIYTVDYQ